MTNPPIILIVDDNERNRNILNDLIIELGHTPALAENGLSALAQMKKQPPDIVLLDILMPKMNGYEVLNHIKNDNSLRHIPVIMITALDDIDSVVRCIKKGADDYIVKPFNPTLLKARIGGSLEKKQLHDHMKKQNEILEQKKKEAEDATKLKDKFVSLVAHDLKSPFNSILGFLQIISSDKKNPLFPKHKELIDHTITSGKGLLNMIEELLKISRLQTGKMMVKKKFFDANFPATYAAGNLGLLAEEKGIKLINNIPRGTRIFADVDLFGEVIQNLVSNSIKFCNKGDRITMFILPGNATTFAVKDTGVGISKKILPVIFEHGEMTTTTGTAGEKGTGLGLPFSYDIMQAHGGKLRVESKEGEGAAFYAELPMVRPKILIVDDSELVHDVIIDQMQHLNLNFDGAENGKEALKYLEGKIPHLILLDIEMPGMNGFELLKRIRKNPATKLVPVIVITGSSDVADREKAFQLGANDFITKPLVMEDAIPKVRRFIG